MAYALKSEAHGTFIGVAMGLAFFSKGDTAGQHIANTQDTLQSAEELKGVLITSIDDIEIVEVKSGHWRDLQAAGLHIGDMADNELMVMEPMGAA